MIEIGNSIISLAAAGENHTIFSDSTSLYGCGSNIYGQLGVGEEEKILKVFHKAKGFDNKGIEVISAGGEHCFAVTTRGEVYSWGLNFKGQLGSGNFDNRYVPEVVENLLPQDDKHLGSSKSNTFFMKRSKSREQMKGKPKGNTSRPSKSAAPDERGGDYKELKPSKSVDLANKNNREEGIHDPSSESALFPKEKVTSIS